MSRAAPRAAAFRVRAGVERPSDKRRPNGGRCASRLAASTARAITFGAIERELVAEPQWRASSSAPLSKTESIAADARSLSVLGCT
jgi:hypothetical protein